MTDFDYDAMTRAKDATRGTLTEAHCGTCSRAIYRERPYPGVATEWRHHSSGQPISWSPEKHLAGQTKVVPHAHRFRASKAAVATCEVTGCDTTMPRLDKVAIEAAVLHRRTTSKSDKEAAMQESRERGAKRAHETTKRKIPF